MPKITEMYAFIMDDGPDEGIIAMKMGDTFMPMVGADMDRVKALRPHVQRLENSLGKKAKLIKFTTRTDEEV